MTDRGPTESATEAITLPADDRAPAAARRAVRGHIGAGPVAEVAEVLTSEIVTNVLRHRGHESGKDLLLAIVTEDDTHRVEVVAVGPPLSGPSRDDHPGGFGLLLVDRLADAWGLEAATGEVRAWFRLAVAPATP
jgi:anti-sigma regulatory factor (Ser/Thr protein kinase)